MKRSFLITLFAAITIMASSQTKIALTTGNRTVTASLADNPTTAALLATLQQGPVTVSMSDYGGFEKVGALPRSFPTADTRITTQPGDIMLYQGNNIVIFYGSNTWSYTPLGKIDGATANTVKEFLGSGDITLTLSLDPQAGIDDVTVSDTSDITSATVYGLNGLPVSVRPLPAGLYIINGKKTIVR